LAFLTFNSISATNVPADSGQELRKEEKSCAIVVRFSNNKCSIVDTRYRRAQGREPDDEKAVGPRILAEDEFHGFGQLV
jgi:hypothetical protein